MAKMTITYEDDFGLTRTITQEYESSDHTVQEFFETCLRAYEAFTFQNGIDIDILGLSGDVTSTLHWDADDGYREEIKMGIFEDLARYSQNML